MDGDRFSSNLEESIGRLNFWESNSLQVIVGEDISEFEGSTLMIESGGDQELEIGIFGARESLTILHFI